MELRNQIYIDASADQVWEALGERFMMVSEWAAPITSSCPVDQRTPGIGVTRSCTIAAFGPVEPGIVKERLTKFDRERMVFEYEAIEGMPRFVEHAVNRWGIVSVNDARSIVRIHATVRLRGIARVFSWLFERQFQSGGARVAEELKYFVERGEPHPRKQAATGKLVGARCPRPPD